MQSIFNFLIPAIVALLPNGKSDEPSIGWDCFFMEHFRNRSLENIIEGYEGIIYTEQWKDIIGYDGVYQISTFGRIKSLARKPNHQNWRPDIILKQCVDFWGYAAAALAKNGKFQRVKGHRLVALHFIPNPLNFPDVNHIKGIKTDNRIHQLEWISESDNDKHAFKIGLKRQDGDFNNGRKLNSKQVLRMREMHKTGKWNCTQLATKFNISVSHTWLIVTNGIWKNI